MPVEGGQLVRFGQGFCQCGRTAGTQPCRTAARAPAGLYASPKLGDHNFAAGFDAQVTNYTVMNYEHDVVPLVPPFDITHLDLYRPLPYVFTITDEMATAVMNSADKGCCHHLIDYIAMLSPPVFNASKPTWTADEIQCAKCVETLRV